MQQNDRVLKACMTQDWESFDKDELVRLVGHLFEMNTAVKEDNLKLGALIKKLEQEFGVEEPLIQFCPESWTTKYN